MFALFRKTAEEELVAALEREKLVVWPVNPQSEAYRDGYHRGVSLSWPGPIDTIRLEIDTIRAKVKFIAEQNRLTPLWSEPVPAAGGALVVYCGFKEP